MAVMNINPTRMQLKKLKQRLTTAVRGHKLLKDKNDELMKQFLDTVRENMRLRAAVEQKVLALHGHFTAAAAAMSPEYLSQALLLPKQSVTLEIEEKNIMSVRVPNYHFHTRYEDDGGGILPYGTVNTCLLYTSLGEYRSRGEAAARQILERANAEAAAETLRAEGGDSLERSKKLSLIHI